MSFNVIGPVVLEKKNFEGYFNHNGHGSHLGPMSKRSFPHPIEEILLKPSGHLKMLTDGRRRTDGQTSGCRRVTLLLKLTYELSAQVS